MLYKQEKGTSLFRKVCKKSYTSYLDVPFLICLNISFYCFYILSLIFNYNSPIRVCSLAISYNKPIVLKG